ncbi:hypothetical protein A3Q56_05366, partial [Intoshia linei]
VVDLVKDHINSIKNIDLKLKINKVKVYNHITALTIVIIPILRTIFGGFSIPVVMVPTTYFIVNSIFFFVNFKYVPSIHWMKHSSSSEVDFVKNILYAYTKGISFSIFAYEAKLAFYEYNNYDGQYILFVNHTLMVIAFSVGIAVVYELYEVIPINSFFDSIIYEAVFDMASMKI